MNIPRNSRETDVTIVGGGISGTSLHYGLRHVSGVSSVLVEKKSQVGQGNTHHTQNSQTLHVGDIESNYSLEKARVVNSDALLMQTYVTKDVNISRELYSKVGKMLVGVGEKEVAEVTDRYNLFTVQEKLFPHNQLLNREQIAQIEPKLVEGRDPSIPMVAYYNPEGYAINFDAVCASLIDDVQKYRGDLAQTLLGVGVDSINRLDDGRFETILDDGSSVMSKAVVVSAGAYTPVLMNRMGYGSDKGILSIGAHYYRIKPEAMIRITNKVYMVQQKSLPFAALHLDPEVDDPSIVRLGPTAFGIPYLEKGKWTSFFDYMSLINWKHDIPTFMNIMSDPVVRAYIIKNFKFLIPIYGKRLFLKDARKIIPTLTLDDIEEVPGYGGTRPQITDRNEHTLNMGEAKVLGNNENLIFNITPSPGASTAFGTAHRDIGHLLQMPGFEHYHLNQQARDKDLVR